MAIEAAHRRQDLFQQNLHPLPGQGMFDGPQDHRVFGAGDIVADQQLLVELFRGTQAGVGNLDVPVGMLLVAHGQSHEIDHAPRQISDPHRLAHVEHEHIAALGHGAGLDDELRSLRDGHEVADHLRMRHGDRTAGFDLFIEQRHHRTGRGQHIAESHHAKPRLAAAPMQSLQDDFREALGGTHHVGGVDRLVGGHQHERIHIGLVRGLGGVPGGDHIVVDPLDDILLDDRHVFVCSGVVHGLHPIGLHDVAQAGLVMGIADQPDQIDRQRMLVGESRAILARCCKGPIRTFRTGPAASGLSL